MFYKFAPRFSILFFLTISLSIINVRGADTLRVESPSGRIKVKVWMGKLLAYTVSFDDRIIVEPSFIDLKLDNNRSLSGSNAIRSGSVKKHDEVIISPVPEKRKLIPDRYNDLNISFRQPYKVEFRVYDDGLAYRVSTAFKDSVTVIDEVAEFVFPDDPSAYFPEIPGNGDPKQDLFHCSWEDVYTYKKLSELALTSLTYSPLLIVPASGPKLAITESDLEDYPGMFLKGTGTSKMKGVFAGFAIEEKINRGLYSNVKVSKRAAFIARTKGTRTYPWRVIVVSEHDKDLPANDIVYRLASPSRVKDVSWVDPGNLTEEWIIDLNIYNVPFKAGRNTATYKYYIDFASRFGIKYVMMDAGWSDNDDLLKVVPEISMDTLIAYAKSKKVKIAMWTLALTLDRQLDSALAQFNKWGVDFIMTDFI
ncbi:MAG: glycoside hydrolase family 97 protein, partial [Chitinophagaceae bacterium]